MGSIIKNIYTKIAVVTVLILVAGGSLFMHSVSAATGTIYLTPSSQSIQNGSSFTLNLRVNPGTAIDTVSANVGFDAAKLSLTAISCSGSPFTPVQCASGNPAQIASAILGSSTSADSFVASLTFKALVGSGTSSVTVSGDTAYAGNAQGAGTAGTTVTFTTPATPTCPAGTTGTYPNCKTTTTSGGTTTPPKTTTTTPPKTTTPTTTTTPVANSTALATVEKQDVQFTKAVFTATTPVPAQVYCQFGTDSKALTGATSLDALGTTHKIDIDESKLLPGTTYYYVIVSKDQKGTVTQSTVQSFTTKGLTITVGIFDKNHKPVTNKTVTLHSTPMTAKTDSKGIATFSNVTVGTHHVIYADNKKSYDQSIAVENNVKTVADIQTAPIQNASVVYGFTQSSSMVVRVVIISLLVLVAAAAAIVIARRKVKFAAPGGTPLSMEPVVVGGNHQTPNFHSGGTPSSQETSERLSNIPDPDQPEPGSNVEPHGGDRGF
jgi:hypothetical protein